MTINERCSVCNKRTPTDPSRRLFWKVCKQWLHFKCTLLTHSNDYATCTECISISLPFINIDDDVDYSLAIRGIDDNNHKLDITKFITNNNYFRSKVTKKLHET